MLYDLHQVTRNTSSTVYVKIPACLCKWFMLSFSIFSRSSSRIPISADTCGQGCAGDAWIRFSCVTKIMNRFTHKCMNACWNHCMHQAQFNFWQMFRFLLNKRPFADIAQTCVGNLLMIAHSPLLAQNDWSIQKTGNKHWKAMQKHCEVLLMMVQRFPSSLAQQSNWGLEKHEPQSRDIGQTRKNAYCLHLQRTALKAEGETTHYFPWVANPWVRWSQRSYPTGPRFFGFVHRNRFFV